MTQAWLKDLYGRELVSEKLQYASIVAEERGMDPEFVDELDRLSEEAHEEAITLAEEYGDGRV